jgi:tetratricopeptide (TPR) repeat protein
MSARRRKPRVSSESNPPITAGRKGGDSAPSQLPRSRGRKWLYRVGVAVLSPLLFLIMLEAGLRLGGYGYPTGFFVGPDAEGVYRSNLRFGWRFFPRSIARTPVPGKLSSKPAGTIRIFVLGESAAQGIPDPSFSVGRVLAALLQERYPEVKFEVVNAAMTAINSHVVSEIVRDCAAHQPDLFVVYMGNNEVLGPYGPGTVLQQSSPNSRLIRANMWFKSTRIGQLLSDTAERFRSGSSAPVWRGLAMFMDKQVTADDPRLSAVYDNFRANLVDICGIARQAGAKVVLSTVAVNLKDCPPFASRHRSDLSSEELASWKALYQEGVDLEDKGKRKEAIVKYEAAAKIDDRFAELAFRRGRCLAALGRSKEAGDQFVLARDLDALRFRADSRINAVIREVAAEQEAAGVRLADAERLFAESDLADSGIPGEQLFYEHVHFKFDGNCLLARTLLAEVEAALPQLANSRKPEPIPSSERCAELLTLTPWDEYQMANLMAEVLARPPFTAQLDHAIRTSAARKRAGELGRSAGTPSAIEAAYRSCEAAFESSPDDWRRRQHLGKLALASGRPKTALEHFQAVAKQFPGDPGVNMDLAGVEKGCGQLDEAIGSYRKALEIDPGLVMANYNLAAILDQRGQIHEAVASFQKAVEADPEFAAGHTCLGAALGRCGRTEEAIAEYEKSLTIDANSALAHSGLGQILHDQGRSDEAIAHFRKALESDPNCALAHNNWGVTLVGCRQFDEAIAHFQQALKIRPDYREARANIEKTIQIRDHVGENR